MQHSAQGSNAPLRILHVLRAPVGGLFRHVFDLSTAQIARGHKVGLIVDSLTGGDMARSQLAALRPNLALGLARIPIRRLPHPSDWRAARVINARIAEIAPDVVHGHGSKGGVFARCGRLFDDRGDDIRVYTPHGGSLNYRPGTLSHRGFMAIEALLAARTDALLFESAFIARRFETRVGTPDTLARVIRNGVTPAEFTPVTPRADAADLLFVGELRTAKGIDTLIDALAVLARQGLTPHTAIIGDGPDRQLLIERARRAGVSERLIFGPPRPAREAFACGRALVVPSRAESLPYIVLEAAGAGLPMVATNVGGVGEIYGPYANRLIPADDPEALAQALRRLLTQPSHAQRADSQALAEYVGSHFTVARMADEILQSYRDALTARAARPGAR